MKLNRCVLSSVHDFLTKIASVLSHYMRLSFNLVTLTHLNLKDRARHLVNSEIKTENLPLLPYSASSLVRQLSQMLFLNLNLRLQTFREGNKLKQQEGYERFERNSVQFMNLLLNIRRSIL